MGVLPAGLGGAGHGVATHVARFHVALHNELAHLGLDRDDIRQPAARGVFLDGVEDRGNRIHGHRDDNKRIVLLGAPQDGRQIIGDVVALLNGRSRTRGGVVVAVHGMACSS